MWRVTVNDNCIGSGVCAGTAPRYFSLGADGRAQPPPAPVPADELIRDAADSCPMEAIEVIEE